MTGDDVNPPSHGEAVPPGTDATARFPSEHFATDPILTPEPERRRDPAIPAIIITFFGLVALIGVGAYLVGRGDADDAATTQVPTATSDPEVTDTSTAELDLTTTAEVTTTTTTTTTATTTVPATTTAPTTLAATTLPPTTAAPTTAPPTTPPTTPPLAAGLARADLDLYFATLRAGMYDEAYAYLSAGFAPPFSEYLDFWSVSVASFDAPIEAAKPSREASSARSSSASATPVSPGRTSGTAASPSGPNWCSFRATAIGT